MIAATHQILEPATASERRLTPAMRAALAALIDSASNAVRTAHRYRWLIVAFLLLAPQMLVGIAGVVAIAATGAPWFMLIAGFVFTVPVSLFAIAAVLFVLHWYGAQSRAFERDLTSGIYHEIVGDLRVTMQRCDYRLIVNGSPLPLNRDPVAMMKLVVDGPSSLPDATVRYAAAAKWLLEIKAADGQIVYRDPKLEAASRS